MHACPIALANEPFFARPQILRENRADGCIILRNAEPLPPVATTLPARLMHWSRHAPQRIFLSEPFAGGGDRVLSYRQAGIDVRWLGAKLLSLPVSVERPLMLVAANSINHALLMLAATHVGIPCAVVSPAYVTAEAEPWSKFHSTVSRVRPGLIVADDPVAVNRALAGCEIEAIPAMPTGTLGWLEWRPSSAVERTAAAVEANHADAPAKLLFTSGSTGTPKAVINTQRMMVSNMMALELAWPSLASRPPVLVDWLPWNHTFGGNFCFNIALWFGGTLNIDGGRPTPAMIGKTIEALREIAPTIYFNVPAGFEALLPALEGDHRLAASFFSRLDVLFNAGAAMPEPVRTRLQALSRRTLGRTVPVLGAWGATETAPCATLLSFEAPHPANLGVPLPGTEIKLVPTGGRTELRVRGPNVMPGYFGEPEATAAAFDEEGYYRIGDAGLLADPQRPEAGILFDGRIAENFKLSSGTWVNVSEVRLAAIAAAKPLVSDVAVAGEGRSEIGLLVFVNDASCRAYLTEQLGEEPDGNPATHPLIWERIAEAFHGLNASRAARSRRIGRFSIMLEPASFRHGEVTEKGYLNQRAVLERRAAQVEELYRRGSSSEN